MRINRVADFQFDRIVEEEIDLAIFCCGYETRCTAIRKSLTNLRASKTIILGFSEFNDNPRRQTNESFFRSIDQAEFVVASSKDDQFIYNILNIITQNIDAPNFTVLVDYTSMSKIWMGAIINYFSILQANYNIRILFCYNTGEYKSNIEPKAVSKIALMPGFEGVIPGIGRKMGIFGLGYDSISPFAAAERIEPDLAVAFMVDPGATRKSAAATRKLNEEFIHDYIDKTVVSSIFSVEEIYRLVVEVIISGVGNNLNITISPLGPKPQILAFLLGASIFTEVGILQVSGEIRNPFNVTALQKKICTLVEFGTYSDSSNFEKLAT